MPRARPGPIRTPSDRTKDPRQGAKSPNPTPPGAHSNRHMSSERSTPTVSTAHRSRKSPFSQCELHEEQAATCAGRNEVVLVGLDGWEQRLCPAHAAALWLTDPTLRFSAKTTEPAIGEVMRHAFFGGA